MTSPSLASSVFSPGAAVRSMTSRGSGGTFGAALPLGCSAAVRRRVDGLGRRLDVGRRLVLVLHLHHELFVVINQLLEVLPPRVLVGSPSSSPQL